MMVEKELEGASMSTAPETGIAEKLEFERIKDTDIEGFISFLRAVRPDYPYRWFFDRNWIAQRVSDPNYIWGVFEGSLLFLGKFLEMDEEL